jgi:NADPH2:quinone reductase
MKYKRIVIARYGGPEVLQVVEGDLPEPRSGEVRVKILTAGVAFTDILIREGFFQAGWQKGALVIWCNRMAV